MQELMKYSLVLQMAVAGVALAQVQSDRPLSDNTGATGAGTMDQKTVDTGTMNRDRMAPAGTVRASKALGTEVYNPQGKHLGEIKDIVLDKDNRRVGYVVLSYGGIAGLGDKLFALPRNMVQYSPTGKNRAIVSLDEQVLRNAPGFDQNKWPTEANADYYQRLDQYYQQHGQVAAGQTPTPSDQARAAGDRAVSDLDKSAQKAGEVAKDTSKSADQAVKESYDTSRTARPAAGQVGDQGTLTWNHRVSSLIGTNVKSPQDESLGEVKDLVIDWPAGTVRYAVLSYGGLLGIGDKLFAVPIEQFQARDNDLVLAIDKQQLKDAPGFNKDHWPDMADTSWSRSVDQYYQQHGSSDRNTADQVR